MSHRYVSNATYLATLLDYNANGNRRNKLNEMFIAIMN